jgi:tetratricopeptide (TPR) repeat protein
MFEVPKAIAEFRAAIDLAPAYAGAQAGTGAGPLRRSRASRGASGEAYSEAKTALFARLALDDSCADAQLALSAVLFWSEWNWAAAERSLERALEINPNHTEAYLLYGRLLEAVAGWRKGSR